MLNETNFIVRISGKRDNSYYIDYSGIYKINEIAKIAGLETQVIKEKYLANGGSLDTEFDVYYFNSIESAKKTISDILKSMKGDKRGRVMFLTEAEIEYIRKALINEGGNNLHVSNSVKDAIFAKLNA